VILPVFVFAKALLKGWRTPPGPGTWVPAARSAGFFTWTPVGSLRSPGDPSCTFAPLLDPGRTVVPSPWRSLRCCPRFSQQRRLRTMRISGLTHAASAPALLRFAFRVATHAQGWLPAGWLASTGRELNPLDHYEEFQITDHMIILPSCPPDAMARPFPWGTFTSYSLPACLAHSAKGHNRNSAHLEASTYKQLESFAPASIATVGFQFGFPLLRNLTSAPRAPARSLPGRSGARSGPTADNQGRPRHPRCAPPFLP
jgi:hypothetical protein